MQKQPTVRKILRDEDGAGFIEMLIVIGLFVFIGSAGVNMVAGSAEDKLSEQAESLATLRSGPSGTPQGTGTVGGGGDTPNIGSSTNAVTRLNNSSPPPDSNDSSPPPDNSSPPPDNSGSQPNDENDTLATIGRVAGEIGSAIGEGIATALFGSMAEASEMDTPPPGAGVMTQDDSDMKTITEMNNKFNQTMEIEDLEKAQAVGAAWGTLETDFERDTLSRQDQSSLNDEVRVRVNEGSDLPPEQVAALREVNDEVVNEITPVDDSNTIDLSTAKPDSRWVEDVSDVPTSKYPPSYFEDDGSGRHSYGDARLGGVGQKVYAKDWDNPNGSGSTTVVTYNRDEVTVVRYKEVAPPADGDPNTTYLETTSNVTFKLPKKYYE